MKKAVFCLALLALLLSCEGNNWGKTEIVNNTEYAVTFKFNHTGEFEVSSKSRRKDFETKAYQYLERYEPSKWVDYDFISADDGYTCTFNTRKFWNADIENKLESPVTLSADGWLEKGGKDTVEIPAKYYDVDEKVFIDGKETARIFTDKPQFKAGFQENETVPAEILWSIEKDTMKVTIR
jgi:hypothetical protein